MEKIIATIILAILSAGSLAWLSGTLESYTSEQGMSKEDQQYVQCINNVQAYLLIEEWYSPEVVADFYSDTKITSDISSCTSDAKEELRDTVVDMSIL